ncbi:MAG: histidine kinase [Rikenellaceae bacterium]
MDIGFYLLFIPITIMLVPTDKIIERDPSFFVVMAIFMVIIHSINRRFNFVTYIFKGDWQKTALILLTIGLITYITSKLDITETSASDPTPMKLRQKSLSLLCFIDISFTVMLGLLLELFRQKIKRQSIESEKGKAELAIYRSQINPHFMFNTLNSIYALNFTASPRTGEVIMKFSNIVKYIYQNTDKEKIMIVEEVKYIRELIDLHSLRLDDQTTVNFTSDIDDESLYIPAMIFITFVENVFKYGVSSSEACTIDIVIKLKSRSLLFTTTNRVFIQGGSSTGIGIENCRKRLSLLYPSRYSLECFEQQGIFKTILKIEL